MAVVAHQCSQCLGSCFRICSPARETVHQILIVAPSLTAELFHKRFLPRESVLPVASELLESQHSLCGIQLAWVKAIKCSVEKVVLMRAEALKMVKLHVVVKADGVTRYQVRKSARQACNCCSKFSSLNETLLARSFGLPLRAPYGDENGTDRSNGLDPSWPIRNCWAEPKRRQSDKQGYRVADDEKLLSKRSHSGVTAQGASSVHSVVALRPQSEARV